MKFAINDLEFEDGEQEKIKQVFNISDKKLETFSKELIHAATFEYMRMIRNISVPSSIKDFRIERIFSMTKNCGEIVYPDEETVEKLFNLVDGSGKTVLNSVQAKHRYDLNEEFKKVIREIFKESNSRESDDDDCTLEIKNPSIVTKLNTILAREKPGLCKIKPSKTEAGIYHCRQDTMDFFMKY